MKLESFSKPNGRIVNSAEGYATFVPKLLPPQFYYDHELINLLSKAEVKIGELKGIGSLLKSPNSLIHRYLKKEAVVSSKIEGILASIQDVLQYEAIGNISKQESEHLRLNEVLNYVYALQDNLETIRTKNKKITLEMIKRAHSQLMHEVRGYDKKPGEFRTIQNWIVQYGETAKNSTYTPPPPDYLDELLKNFEEFLNNPPDNMPVLIQCAIMHYQFEAIHPFEDGNGRIGRVLISLLLAEKNILPLPLLYLSEYFQKNISNYYTGLLAISQKSKWREWIKFFLQAITEQADITIHNVHALRELRNTYQEKLKKIHASGSVLLLLDHLVENPYITIPRAQKFLSVAYPSAKNAVQTLMKVGVLEEIPMYYKSKVFRATEIEEVMSH